jgi:hypothetical protein
LKGRKEEGRKERKEGRKKGRKEERKSLNKPLPNKEIESVFKRLPTME